MTQKGDIVALRGNLQLVAAETSDSSNLSCIIRNPATGEDSDPLPAQQALKWGYWEPPEKMAKITLVGREQ